MLFGVALKKAILNLRLNPKVRDEFAIAAELRGASMSGLLHQFIVRTIREEKDLAPQAFRGERPGDALSNGIPVATRSKSPGIPLINHDRRKQNDVSPAKKKSKRAS